MAHALLGTPFPVAWCAAARAGLSRLLHVPVSCLPRHTQATLIIAGIAAVAAAAAVSGGLLVNSSTPGSLADLTPEEGIKSLTAYSEAFAAEAAPAL